MANKNKNLTPELKYCLKSFVKESEIHIGKGVFKLRLKGNNSGKSGCYRLFVLVVETDNVLSPICIYAKSDLASIKMDKLTQHLKAVNAELNE